MPRLLDYSHQDPAWNLAIDEALLVEADAQRLPTVLRLWEFAQPVVVLGRGSKWASEVHADYCQDQQIPILRRCSGGATVMGGPGCLMYSLTIDLRTNPKLRVLDQMHQYVMRAVLDSVLAVVPKEEHSQLSIQGICDLTYQGRKFSGNSVRICRQHVLYHGTILYRVDLDLIARCLAMPPRQPEYRNQRSHERFLVNIPVEPLGLRAALGETFAAEHPLTELPLAQIDDLVRSRYGSQAWNLRH